MGKRSPHTTDRSELMALLWSASSVSNLFLHGPVLGEDTHASAIKTMSLTGSEVWMASSGNRFETER